MTPSFRRFTVRPSLPAELASLRELAYNLWWSWDPEAHELFVRMDRGQWEEVYGNPIELIARIGQKRLAELAADETFTSHLKRATDRLAQYMNATGWYARTYPKHHAHRIAYFSMEFGLHESLPIYSGGLGVLAGDHLKTASDLGLPLVGIGLAYAEGYFRQQLADDGLQQEHYPPNDWRRLPVQPVFDPAHPDKRLLIHVRYPHGMVHAQLWRVQVGRVPLYLLDSNLDENSAEDRSITGPLYGGDERFRIRQEIMLGIGGVHALEALGITPTVCHLNEGHSAFLALERIRRTMERRGVPFQVAREAASVGNLFTTHTPVPAGNDAFEASDVSTLLEPYRKELGLSEDELLSMGRFEGAAPDAPFSMPVLAMRTAARHNGVSALHGHVSRRMWNDLWPALPAQEVPIGSVTNGVHIGSWVSDEMSALFTRYLGEEWRERPDDPTLWARVHNIPDAELWAVHAHRRHRLVQLCRARTRLMAERHGRSQSELRASDELLDPHALTIGFARRFATYKRATLLFSDLERLAALCNAEKRPVQLVFAGKAHPQDRGGKELIREIVRWSRDGRLRGRLLFIENYDMRVGRALVSGVDVWLNNPRRPLEASGTSGMKAAANGGLNLSVLDGWWEEAWHQFGWPVGWAIGNGENATTEEDDRREANNLYDLLEREVVPLFYERKEDRLPRAWIAKMKAAIAHCVPAFNTARMVKEYTKNYYVPALDRTAFMNADDLAHAKVLSAFKDRVKAGFAGVRVLQVTANQTEVEVGEPLRVSARVALGTLSPDDVRVEVYCGPTFGGPLPQHGKATPMSLTESADGGYVYQAQVLPDDSGSHAFAVRVFPYHASFVDKFDAGLLAWG